MTMENYLSKELIEMRSAFDFLFTYTLAISTNSIRIMGMDISTAI